MAFSGRCKGTLAIWANELVEECYKPYTANHHLYLVSQKLVMSVFLLSGSANQYPFMSLIELDQVVTPLLLWTVQLNLKVNDVVVPETLGDDRPVRSILFI